MVGSLVIAKFKNRYIQAIITAIKGDSCYGFEVITLEQLLQKITTEEKKVTYIYHEGLIVNKQQSVILFDKLVKFDQSDLSNPTGDYKDLATAVVGHYNLPKIESMFSRHGLTVDEKAALNEKLEYAYIAIETYEVEIMTISLEKIEDLKLGIISLLGKLYKIGCFENSLEHIWDELMHDSHLHEIASIEVLKFFIRESAINGLTLSKSALGFDKIETTKKGLTAVDLPKSLIVTRPSQSAKKYIKSLDEEKVQKINSYFEQKSQTKENDNSPYLSIDNLNENCLEIYGLDKEIRFTEIALYEYFNKYTEKLNDVTFKHDNYQIKITDKVFIQENKLMSN
jgi:hypothetical protein